MKRAFALAGALCLAGCAGVPASSPAPGPSAAAAQAAASSARLLLRADDQMAAAQYRGAIALYDEFLEAYPADPAAPRARASRAVVERLLLSRGEIERFRREVDTRQGEIERLRREADTRQAEIGRLKADLERLRRIDLRQAPAVR
jgi:epoxyqueuosine reductase QueG